MSSFNSAKSSMRVKSMQNTVPVGDDLLVRATDRFPASYAIIVEACGKCSSDPQGRNLRNRPQGKGG